MGWERCCCSAPEPLCFHIFLYRHPRKLQTESSTDPEGRAAGVHTVNLSWELLKPFWGVGVTPQEMPELLCCGNSAVTSQPQVHKQQSHQQSWNRRRTFLNPPLLSAFHPSQH